MPGNLLLALLSYMKKKTAEKQCLMHILEILDVESAQGSDCLFRSSF
jgi:hypothetical protein